MRTDEQYNIIEDLPFIPVNREYGTIHCYENNAFLISFVIFC
jgi:hypothetical protein